jgi:6-phosphogluconolactonase (cycloisomerase 2 family)
VAGLLALPGSAQALKPVGGLTQISGVDGCWSLTGASEDGAATCHDGRALDAPWAVAVSPGGTSVYANVSQGIVAFERGPFSGHLEQLGPAPGFVSRDGCITVTGTAVDAPVPGACTNGRAVDTDAYGRNIVVSPDERFVYVAAADSNGIAIFSRDPAHGRLIQLAGADGCVTTDGSSEDGAATCQDGRDLNDINGLALSPDGKTLYGASTDDGFVIFSVDTSTGKLTQLTGTQGCVTDDGASEDGAGTCTNGKGVTYSNEIVVSPDGKHVYTVGYLDNSVAAFARDSATGAVTQLTGLDGCISNDGSSEEGAATCTNGVGIDGPFGIDVTRDGKNLYVGLYDINGLSAFSRDAATGKLTQLGGLSGCISSDGSSSDGAGTCQNGRSLTFPYDVTVSPDGLNVYVGNYAGSGAITAFRRDPATGALAQIPGLDGCYTPDGASDDDGAGTCTDIRGGAGGGPLALSPDGAFLYAPGLDDDTVVLLSRQIPAACPDATATTRTNKAVTVPLGCADRNGDPITISIAGPPANGSLGAVDQTADTVVYTPKKDFNGTDTFTYTANDGGELLSNAGTATITVSDTLAASCRVRSKKVSLNKLASGKFTLKLRCNEAARVTAELLAARKQAGVLGLLTRVKRVRIGGGTKKAAPAGNFKLRIKVNRRARLAFEDLTLRQAKRLKLALRFKTRDTAGNRGKRKTTKLKLKR